MSGTLISLVLVALLLASPSWSISLPLHKARDSRLSIFAVDVSKNQHAMKLKNTFDNIYATTINLGGQDIVVQLDTGSSDLWVKDPPFQPTLVTSVPITITYGKGKVSGSLAFAPMTLAGFSISSQSFARADAVVDEDALLNNGITGLMGLGFPSTSEINTAVVSVPTAPRTDARSPLENIFAANATLPKFFTFLLGRLDDPDNETDGVLTISEYVDGLSSIASTPKLSAGIVDNWSLLIDSITIGGRSGSVQSGQPNAPPGKAIAVLDTGLSFSSVPQVLVNAIYSAIPGAVKASDLSGFGGVEWIIPCDQAVSLSFTIGGKEFPVNPLDVTHVAATSLQGQKVTYCTNTFTSINTQTSRGFDMILGDAFLHNVYTSFNYALTDPQTGRLTGPPTVQLLSTNTDTAATEKEFSTIRQKQLQGVPAPFTPVQLRAAALGQSPLPTNAPTASSSSSTPTLSSMESPAPLESGSPTPAPSESVSSAAQGQKENSAARPTNTPAFSILILLVFVTHSFF